MATGFQTFNIKTAYEKGGEQSAPGSPISSSNTGSKASLLVVGIAAILIIAPTLGNWCSLAPDSFDYLTTARSLHKTGCYPDYHMMRPPGFPTLIAPLFQFGDPPLLAIRWLLAASFIVTGILTTALFHRSLGRFPAMAVGLLTITNSVLLMQTTVALSEAVFLPIQLAALIAVERLRRGTSWRCTVVAGLLVACAIMVRTVGAALVPVAMLAVLCRRGDSWRSRSMHATVFLLAAAVMPLLWHLRQSGFPAQSGYGRMWTQAMESETTDVTGMSLQLQRFQRFGAERLADIKRAVVPNHVGWRAFQGDASSVITAVVALLVIIACLVRFAIHREPTFAYALLVLVVVSLWPWDEGVRLVAPLIPIFCAGLIWLLLTTRGWLGQKGAAAATVGIALLLAANTWETIETLRRLPKVESKAVQRLATARSFAETLTRLFPSNAQLICVTEDGSNAKLTFAGGAYLAKLGNTSYLDLKPETNLELGKINEEYAAIERAGEFDGFDRIGTKAMFVGDEFVIIRIDR
ncbi:MAG: glycosyltransferase family 39 protein [Planctomycetes bacterium]|nr:glycosyltransferase family 39 protein [Planctomycetota bacterium]